MHILTFLGQYAPLQHASPEKAASLEAIHVDCLHAVAVAHVTCEFPVKVVPVQDNSSVQMAFEVPEKVDPMQERRPAHRAVEASLKVASVQALNEHTAFEDAVNLLPWHESSPMQKASVVPEKVAFGQALAVHVAIELEISAPSQCANTSWRSSSEAVHRVNGWETFWSLHEFL